MLFRSKKQVASLVMTTMLLTTSLPIAAFADDASTTSPLNTAVVAEASENIIYVNAAAQGDDGQQNTYKTLQAAIDAAKEGDIIQLKSNLTVDASVSNNAAAITIDKNNITIDGQGHTLTVDSNNANGNAIGINGASGVTIQNLTVTRPDDGHTKHGINVYKSTGVTLHNVNLNNMGGLSLLINASEVTATGNFSLSGNGWKDIINVGWGSGISGVSHKSSFDASNATLKGVDLIYVDKGDLERAGNDKEKFAINAKGFAAVDPSSLEENVAIAYAPASIIVNGTGYATLQAAVNNAQDNATIQIQNDITIDNTITVNCPVTITANKGVTVTASSTGESFNLSNGAALSGLTINLAAKTMDHIVIMDSNSTVENCTFTGQFDLADSKTSRALTVQAGAENIAITGNTFSHLRQPGYINNSSGTITNNTVDNTRGWVITGDATVSLSGNTFENNLVDICIIKNNNGTNNYAGKTTSLSKNNNGAYVQNQLNLTEAKQGAFVVGASDGYTFEKALTDAADGDTTGSDDNNNSNIGDTVTNPDGSTTTTVTTDDGSSSTTTVGTDGKVEADVTLTEEAVNNANGGAVALPMPELSVTTNKSEAPTVTVNLPSKDATKVEVPVKDVTPGTVAILVHPDGTEEVIKDTVTSAGGITVALSDGATIKVVDNSKAFSDVSANHWGASAIDFATSRELFAGTGANEFSPEGKMTRAMIWSVLARYEGADTPGGTGSEWYAGPQQWAIDNGISDGTMANSSMTREQLAAMLYRYVGSPAVSGTVGDYSDADSVSSWASDAMVWAVQQGLIAGMDDGTLNPQGTATRTQVAAIFQRFIENKMA